VSLLQFLEDHVFASKPPRPACAGSAATATGNAQAHYVTSLPGPQNALDIFGGEWSSRLPGEFQHLTAGLLPLFEDPRISWFVERLGGIEGKTVLELGPLEGGHTYMLERAGASSIVAIEANTRAFLKCLVVKETLGLQRARFLCGDFLEYLRINRPKVDVCVASGVLYHMTNPLELISFMAQATDRACLWTHYYDEHVLAQRPHLAKQFADHQPARFDGFAHTLHRRIYEQEAVRWQGFCGGTQPTSCWLSRQDILAAFEHFGLRRIEVGFDDPNHANGPSLALVAVRA
jgi:hypothetical protein